MVMRRIVMSNQTEMRTSDSEPKAKVHRPHEEFNHPAEVIADPALAKDEKLSALDALEQDAKQLAIASGEGMSGGEETNLRDVLVAREMIDLRPSDAAFAVVIQTLESKLAGAEGSDLRGVIAHAIDAIHAARNAISRMDEIPDPPRGAPRPGSQSELEEELAKEKLDP
jgi:hypothetical protein